MPNRPNIIFIITDHQAWANHFRKGKFELRFPTWEKFIADGVNFERAYSVCPLCTPARSSMMTGVYPTSHRLLRNCDYGGELPAGMPLYSHHLSSAGYRNAYVGKWHCGHTRLPEDYGIEGWSLPDYGKVYMSDAYKKYAEKRGLGEATALIEYNLNNPEWAGEKKILHHESAWHFMNGSGILQGPPEAHEENFVAHLAMEKLDELSATGQPFSLVASFWGPHQPYFPSEPFASMVDPNSIPEYPSFRDDLSDRPSRHLLHREAHHIGAKNIRDWKDWQRILAKCYGQALQLDDAIGQMLDKLDQLGQRKNTIVIWCSDHGDSVACHGGLWDKAATMTEEVMRVPLAVRWPAALPAGESRKSPVSNLDVTATMLDAAGISVPKEMQSRSLLPVCKSDDNGNEQVICQHHGHGGTNIIQRMIVCGQYKYVAALYDGDELYDLENDPYELNNLIDDPAYAGTLRDLRQKVLDYFATAENENEARYLIPVLQNSI